MSEIEKINKCYFTGTLVDVKDGKELEYTDKKTGAQVKAFAGTFVLKCLLGDKENPKETLVELHNFTKEITQAGKVNKAYAALVGY